MKLRDCILAGIGLCVFILAAITFFNPKFGDLFLIAPGISALLTLILVWNAYAAIRWTHPKTSQDSMVLHLGVKWGLAIGCAWGVVAIVPINIFAPDDEAGAPLWFLGLLSGLLLPCAAGAAGAIMTGSVQIGMRFGFWSSLVGGLIGFLIVIAIGFSSELISSLRVSADPRFWQSERLGNTLEIALYAMFVFGILWGSIAGIVGGWIGLRLYRTGEPPISVSSSTPS